MLWRKRQKDITDWIYNEKKALLVTGARQIGKTYLIKKTLEQENCDYVEFNLIKQPEIVKLLESVSNDDCKTFLERLTIATTHDLKKERQLYFLMKFKNIKK